MKFESSTFKMNKRFAATVIAIVFIFAGLLSGCGKNIPSATPTPSPTQTPEPTPTPLPERMGAYLDNIYMFESIPDQAAQKILDGTLDIYAGGLNAGQLTALNASGIKSEASVRRQYELLVNPADTEELTGMINPFSFAEVRSALNLLLDRAYITDEIFAGGAVPKYQPLIYKSSDYNENEAAINLLSEQYKYDFEAAGGIISQVLTDNGCTINEDGLWSYKKQAIGIIVLIRNDDQLRMDIGEYTAGQLEKLGFLVTRQYVSLSESSTLWASGDPREGLWHIYTGRRTIDTAPLNQSSVFADYYTDLGESGDISLYKHFITGGDFRKKASALQSGGYESLEQRKEYMSALISECNDYSFRIWLVDELAYYPHSAKTEFKNTSAARTDTDYRTVYSLKKTGTWGGELTWGSDSLLAEYVNPVNGSVSPSEVQYLNFADLPLVYENSDTGETKPVFIDSVKMVYQNSIGYINDASWIEVNTADEIAVPNDAVISWSQEKGAAIYADAEYMHDAVGLATAWLATYEREKPKDRDKIKRQQEVIEGLQAVEERGYLTCNVKYTVQYDEDIFGLKWHDGSSFSIADIIMSFITKTQLMDENSSLYDEYYAQQHAGELDNFKGFSIVSENPLIIEYYTDDYSLLASQTIKPFWVDYGTGQQSWAQAAAAGEAVRNKTATYSQGISDYYGFSLLDYVKGQDGFDALLEAADNLKDLAYIPYAELLDQYILPESVKSHYQNIVDFYSKHKHLYIGLGPYMITSVDSLTPSLTLSAFPEFPIAADAMAEKFK